ncbi:hypothetical protein LLG96_08400 [bacterium]|nr:hypothetical protein [bacterium]
MKTGNSTVSSVMRRPWKRSGR